LVLSDFVDLSAHTTVSDQALLLGGSASHAKATLAVGPQPARVGAVYGKPFRRVMACTVIGMLRFRRPRGSIFALAGGGGALGRALSRTNRVGRTGLKKRDWPSASQYMRAARGAGPARRVK